MLLLRFQSQYDVRICPYDVFTDLRTKKPCPSTQLFLTAHYWLLTGFSQYSISCCFYATSNIKFSVMNCTWVFIALTFQCEHEKLLWHPLVENFIFQKFWLRTFPLLLLNMLLYCAILVALNSFVLVVPRPGPDSATCETQPASSDNVLPFIQLHNCSLVKLIITSPIFIAVMSYLWGKRGGGMNYKGMRWGYNLLHPSKYICGSLGRIYEFYYIAFFDRITAFKAL